jgi:hypothetical protein
MSVQMASNWHPSKQSDKSTYKEHQCQGGTEVDNIHKDHAQACCALF